LVNNSQPFIFKSISQLIILIGIQSTLCVNFSLDFFLTSFGIKDSVILGGDGQDTFNVGTGQGTVDGGSGDDRLIITHFQLGSDNKPTNVAVSTGAEGEVLISGTTDNLGNTSDIDGSSNIWTQRIIGVEQFLVNGNTFTTSQFVSAFGFSTSSFAALAGRTQSGLL
jgi:hypothetical protein